MVAMPSAVWTCIFIDPSVCAFGRLAIDARDQFDRAGDLEIEESQRALGVQPVDQVLDVGRRILRVHQAGDRIFEFLAVEDDRGVHRKQVVLAGVVDMQMGVADEADVAHAHAVARELVLDHVLMELQAAHAERFHDLVGAVAGVDHDRIGAADNQKAQRQHPARAPAVAAEHQEARFQLDVPIVENLDFQSHTCLPYFLRLFSRAGLRARSDRPASPCRA